MLGRAHVEKEMRYLNRRSCLATMAGAICGTLARGFQSTGADQNPQTGRPLALKDYSPRPALHVPETSVPRSRFPVIDSHVHLSTLVQRPMPSSDVPRKEGPEGPQASMSTKPEDVLALMDRKNIRMMVNVTGGYGPALDDVLRYWHTPTRTGSWSVSSLGGPGLMSRATPSFRPMKSNGPPKPVRAASRSSRPWDFTSVKI